MTDPAIAHVDVLLCTYRRPDLLLKTLAGVERAASGVGAVRIVVVDNDAKQSAREATLQWAAGASVRVTYLSQPLQNISLTRNMALANATAPWIALIDDDEVPDENWLSSLLDAARRFNADVVFAPVISEFDSSAPRWATHGSIFERRRFPTGAVVPLKEARTGNVLLRATRMAGAGFRFDPELGLSGGEDSEFFARVSKEGYRMVWCDEACVREWTPPSRTTKTWVLQRAFRVGSVEAYNRRRLRRSVKTAIGILKASVFLLRGAALGLCWAPLSPDRSVASMRKAAFGAGFFYGLIAGPYSEYQAPAAKKEITP